LFYNTQRPHNSLKNQEPMKTVVDYLKKSNRCGTDTLPSFILKNLVYYALLLNLMRIREKEYGRRNRNEF